jgi:hypothetical protein
MKRDLVRRPSPALAVSLVALFLALGGTSYAAFRLPKNSVGTRQLKNGAVTRKKLAPKLIVRRAKVAALAGHANSADNATTATSAASAINAGHATTADSAANAAHATTANNADTVGGFVPNELGPVYGTQFSTTLSDTDGEKTIGTLGLPIPAETWSGFALVDATVDISGAPSTVPVVRVRLVMPQTGVATFWHDAVLANDGTSYVGNVSMGQVFPATMAVQVLEIHALVVGTGTVHVNADVTTVASPYGGTFFGH